jgi:hypothetical protein
VIIGSDIPMEAAVMRLGWLVLATMVAGATLAQAAQYQVTVTPQSKPRGFEKLKISKAAIGSTPIRIWANTAIEPDCTAHVPGATLTILEPPAHGQATVSDEPFYAGFPPANPRSACNSRKVPGHQAFYTAASGYNGHDHLVLQGSSPEGQVRQVEVEVDVR